MHMFYNKISGFTDFHRKKSPKGPTAIVFPSSEAVPGSTSVSADPGELRPGNKAWQD